MMPSRGASLMRPVLGRRLIAQQRQLSFAASTFRSSQINARPRISPSLERHIIPISVLSGIQSFRNASTTTAATTQTPPEVTTTSTLASDLDSLNLGDIDLTKTVIDATQGVGYLKELGINFGYGPSSCIQWVLENYHFTLGLPWWGAIVATAVMFRLMMFPLFVRAADSTARGMAMTSVTAPIYKKMQDAQRSGDRMAMQMEWAKLAEVRKQAGVSMTAQFVPIVLQSVVGFCGFRNLSNMAALPVPDLKEGGFLWLTDLTIPDGYLIIPAAMALSMHMIFRLGGETASNTAMSGGMKTFLEYGMPGIVFIIVGWQSGALALWFGVGSIFSITQALLFRSAAFRSWVGIAPRYVPTKADGQQPSWASMLGRDDAPETTETPQEQPSVRFGTSSPKSTVYMRPTYQAPKSPSQQSRIIDTTLSTPVAAKPVKEKPAEEKKPGGISGIFQSVKKGYKSVIDKSIQETDRKAALRQQEAAAKAEKARIQDLYKKRGQV